MIMGWINCRNIIEQSHVKKGFENNNMKTKEDKDHEILTLNDMTPILTKNTYTLNGGKRGERILNIPV